MISFIDTHTHLFLNQFKDDRFAAVKRAIDAGVTKMFLPNVDKNSIEGLLELSNQFPQNCFPILGVHPTSVNDDYEEVIEYIENLIKLNKIYGIGETGIDLYWDKSTLNKQITAFKSQINLAKKYNLPIIIHARESYKEIFDVLETENDESLTGVFHCFTSNKQDAERILSFKGFKLGIGGVLTYKTSNLAEVLKDIDLKHIVLETDSPFLPPIPHRGKRNESKYIINIADFLANSQNISLEKVAEITTKNALELFKI